MLCKNLGFHSFVSFFNLGTLVSEFHVLNSERSFSHLFRVLLFLCTFFQLWSHAVNRSQESEHVVFFTPERGMSEKTKITENHYNRFLTSFKLRGPQICGKKGGKIVLTKYTLRLSLNLLGFIEGLKLNSRDKGHVLQSCLKNTLKI